jgi:hypothetical protein
VSSLPKERIILEKVIFWYIFLIQQFSDLGIYILCICLRWNAWAYVWSFVLFPLSRWNWFHQLCWIRV